ncbi:MAG: tetratricopeptide repeat protein, partial [Flavobacteriales bacterium]
MRWPKSNSLRTLVTVILCFAAYNMGLAQTDNALFNTAENLFANGKYKEAKELYTQVISADKENVNAYLRRGFCNSVLQDYDAAVADFSLV